MMDAVIEAQSIAHAAAMEASNLTFIEYIKTHLDPRFEGTGPDNFWLRKE